MLIYPTIKMSPLLGLQGSGGGLGYLAGGAVVQGVEYDGPALDSELVATEVALRQGGHR